MARRQDAKKLDFGTGWMTDPNTFTQACLSAFTPSPAATRTWMSTMTNLWTMSLTAQQVIWLRLSKLATEGATLANQREVQRMVSEKVAALNESASGLANAGVSMAAALPGAVTDPKKAQRLVTSSARSAGRAVRPFSKRVNANHRRLTKD